MRNSMDWKIGFGFSALLFAFAIAAGEPAQAAPAPDPFGHMGLHTMERLPMDDDGIQRLGVIVTEVTGEHCGYAIAFEHTQSGMWFGMCDDDWHNSFAWAPSGDIVETGNIVDVINNTLGVQVLDIRAIDPQMIMFNFIQY